MHIEFVQLASRPDLLRMVSTWIFDQWWSVKPENTVETVEKVIGTHMTEDRVPLTLVALVDGEPAGTLSLVHKDHGVEDRPETPWVAAVLTLEQHRHKGIGAALMREVERVARGMGLDSIHLITAQPAFYAQVGWEVLCEHYIDDPDDVIMIRRLCSP